MAFILGRLVSSGRPARLSGKNFIRFQSYATDDSKAEVLAAGYFNRARSDLSVGSLIKAEVDCDGTQETVFISVVSMPLNGDITTAEQGGGVPDGSFIMTFDDPDGTEYILTFDDLDTSEYILTAEAT